ncbi:hypothetical protein FB446DRAFT_710220 [Lentinula raphanica]|nr:hypothetical protein FB446DRAFT_710220 [Lentinula raphanica]
MSILGVVSQCSSDWVDYNQLRLKTRYTGTDSCLYSYVLAEQLLGEPVKISLNNFSTKAWKHHISIKNWPVGAAFPKVGEEKKEDNKKKSLKSPTHHIRMAHLQREYNALLNQVPPNASEIQVVMYGLEYWTEGIVHMYMQYRDVHEWQVLTSTREFICTCDS